MMKNYYEILGVDPDAEPEVITSAHKALVRKYHPDKYKGQGAEERMKEINEAYEVLNNPLKRADYDRRGQSRSSPPPSEMKKDDPGQPSRENAKKEKKPADDALQAHRKADRARKWDEFWVPYTVIAAVLISFVALIFISSKSRERINMAEIRDRCHQHFSLDGDVAMTLISYHQEKGKFPVTLDSMREFLKKADSAAMKSVNEQNEAIDKDLYNTWKKFYCPSEAEDYDIIYTYADPPLTAPDDFVVIKCPMHTDCHLKLGDLKKIESSFQSPQGNPDP